MEKEETVTTRIRKSYLARLIGRAQRSHRSAVDELSFIMDVVEALEARGKIKYSSTLDIEYVPEKSHMEAYHF